MELQAVRHQIARYIEAGNMTEDVLRCLVAENRFCPAEGVLFDYKSEVPTDNAIKKLLKHIAAFHNTYGGYLVFGAKEVDKDKTIVPCGLENSELPSKQVRDLVRIHLSAPIELQSAKLSITTTDGTFEVLLMHIPKRTVHEPSSFIRTVNDDKGKPIFKEGDVYLRDGDNSIAAEMPAHWRLLYSARKNPYGDQLAGLDVSPLLENNLPDRSLICSDFIGREDAIEALWRWVGDDFSCVRVLAGEGGLGKTSIAYEFSEDICRTAPAGFEQVVWLSAKRQQFKGLSNHYEKLPTPPFGTAKELFEQLFCHFGGLDAELEFLNEQNTPKRIRQLAGVIKSFVVLDDLDSLTPDDQKRAIEVCQQMAGSGSRFLFTTRKNTTASTTSATEIKGFDPDEFKEFVSSWSNKLSLQDVNAAERKQLYETTRGSPLYTESILRLLRSGMPFNEAIREWKGKLGADVRLAALEREVKQLTHEARRVLAAAAIYRECSFTELKQATKYSVQTLNDCIEELQSLFLIHAPKIAQESRFNVPETTRELVRSLGDALIDKYQTFENAIKKSRYESTKAVKNNSLSIVGNTIRQAIAQLKDSRPDDALRAVDEVNTQFESRNPDLLFMRGRVLQAFTPPRISDARKAFRLAYDLGQRKEMFFSLWFDAEANSKSLDSAIEVCEKAIANGVGNKGEWYETRAKVRIQSSRSQDAAGDRDHAIAQLKLAADDLVEAAKPLKKRQAFSQQGIHTHELMILAHEELWRLSAREAKDVPSWVSVVDIQLETIARGDKRAENYDRLADAVAAVNRTSLAGKSGRSTRAVNLVEQSIRRATTAFDQAPASTKNAVLFERGQKTLKNLRAEYGTP